MPYDIIANRMVPNIFAVATLPMFKDEVVVYVIKEIYYGFQYIK